MVSRVLRGTVLWASGLATGLGAMLGAAHGVTPQPLGPGLPTGAIAQQAPHAQTSSYTVLYVNASAGDDQIGDGSQMRPLRTITYALRIAPPNTVIVLAPGIYSAQTGEQFPLQLRPGITVQGTPGPNVAEVVIQGNSAFTSTNQGLRNATLLGADRAGLANVTINNPHPNGHGLWIEGGSPVVLHNAFVGSGATGIYIAGAGSPVIQGNLFLENGEAGLVINGPSSAQVQGNVFENTGTGIQVAPNATPQILNNRITRNQDGIVLHAEAQPVLRDNQISDNRRNSVLDYAAWPTATPEPALLAALPTPQALGTVTPPTTTPTAAAPATTTPAAATPAAAIPTAATPTESIPAAVPPATGTVPVPVPRTASPEEAAIAAEEIPATDPVAIAVVPPTAPPAATPEPVAPVTAAIGTGRDTAIAVPQPITPLDTAALPPTSGNTAAAPGEGTQGNDPAAALRERIRASRAARVTPVSDEAIGEGAIAIPIIPPPATATPAVAAGPALPAVPSQAATPLPTPSTAPPGPLANNILIVPDTTIPIGSGGSATPLALATPDAGGPPPPPSRASSLGLYYRVFVEANDDAARTRLRALVPDTFQVQVNGRPMMQAGAFNTLAEAQRTADWLNASGFSAQVEYVP
ncbi:MAG: DUF1565 domain-containing protein [Leptolyngbya sp.]|nr:DUF1565 domain-containing protein [Leptolyngbya sp.]